MPWVNNKVKKKRRRKTSEISRSITFEPTGTVAQLLERMFCWEVVGSFPGRIKPNTLQMVVAALSLALSIEKAEMGGPVSV